MESILLHLLRNSEICRGVEFLFQSAMIVLLVLSAIQSVPSSRSTILFVVG